jgi:hypothetical protein
LSLPSEGAQAGLSDAELQRSFAALVREYARRADEEKISPFPPDHEITATEAMITVSAILSATGLQLFELGMWQAWSGRS